MFFLYRTTRCLGIFRKAVVQRGMIQTAMTSRATHEQRTATECRESGIHAVTLANIEQINHEIRLLQLRPDMQDHGNPIKARAPTSLTDT